MLNVELFKFPVIRAPILLCINQFKIQNSKFKIYFYL